MIMCSKLGFARSESSLVNKASATKRVETVSILGRVKQRLKICLRNISAKRSTSKGTV